MCVSGNGLLAAEAADDNGHDSVPREVTWCPQSLCSADVRDTVGGTTSQWIPLRANQRLGDLTNPGVVPAMACDTEKEAATSRLDLKTKHSQERSRRTRGWNGQKDEHLRRQRNQFCPPK